MSVQYEGWRKGSNRRNKRVSGESNGRWASVSQMEWLMISLWMATYAPGLTYFMVWSTWLRSGYMWFKETNYSSWGGALNVLTMVLFIILYLECSLYVKSLLTFQRSFQVLFIERSLPYLTWTTQIFVFPDVQQHILLEPNMRVLSWVNWPNCFKNVSFDSPDRL